MSDGQKLERISWTDTCTGCFEPGEYMGMAHHYSYDKKAHCYVGSGCHECGYTGKRRRIYCLPTDTPASQGKA